MKVNGIDLKEKYGSKIRIGQQTIRERTIVNFTDWIDEYDSPTTGQEPKHKFFDVEAELIVIGTSKTDAELIVSNIIADCRSGEIELDNVDLILTGELKEAEKEFKKRWVYALSLKFQAWDKMESEVTVTIDDASSKTVDVAGNLETPCIIELIPSGAITKYTIKGAARDPVTGEAEDIVIKNLSAGKKVIIDGEACTVTEDGANKYADTEMWEFPTLLPGANALTFTSSSVPCDVTIKYKPRYI